MNIWENENISWYPDDKNLGLVSQTFKRYYHTIIKNMDPMAVVLGTLHFFEP